MDLQLVRLVKKLLRGEKLPAEVSPATKIHRKIFNGDQFATPQILAFPSGKVKKVCLKQSNCWAGGAVVVNSVLNLQPGPLVPCRAPRVIGVVNYGVFQVGPAGASANWTPGTWEYDSQVAIENPTIVGMFTGASQDVEVEVHYE